MALIRHVRANAIAYLALFVALGGTSYAISKVGPRDIKRDAVRAKHIKEPSVGKRLGSGVYFGHADDFFAPGGASTAAGVPLIGFDDLNTEDADDARFTRLLAPVKLRVRDLRAEAEDVAPRQVILEVVRLNDSGPPVTRLLRCVIPAGASGCSARGPSAVLRPGQVGLLQLNAPAALAALPERDYDYSLRIVPG